MRLGIDEGRTAVTTFRQVLTDNTAAAVAADAAKAKLLADTQALTASQQAVGDADAATARQALILTAVVAAKGPIADGGKLYEVQGGTLVTKPLASAEDVTFELVDDGQGGFTVTDAAEPDEPPAEEPPVEGIPAFADPNAQPQ
jgi:hypothetical protein